MKVKLLTNFSHKGKKHHAGDTVDLPEEAFDGLTDEQKDAVGVSPKSPLTPPKAPHLDTKVDAKGGPPDTKSKKE